MYRITFTFDKKIEKKIIRHLYKAGLTGYFLESVNGNNYIHIFSESLVPQDLPSGLVPVSVDTDDKSGWLNSWAENFEGFELTENIYITAEGTEQSPDKYEHIITIDPRGAFGDGHHPTTRLCAQLLEEYLSDYENPENLNMIDVGTGSGMLAIEAYVLGLRMIELFDIDEIAVNMAEKNLVLNGITGIKPFIADLYNYRFNKKYNIITANLLTGLLENNMAALAGALDFNGALIVSGVSAKWTSLVKSLIKRNNLIILKHKKLEGWNGFLLKKSGKDSAGYK